MRPINSLLILGIVSIWLSSVDQVGAFERPSRTTRAERPEIALHYDLWVVEGTRVDDASGKKHDGTISNGRIVYGRNKNAVSLNGDGSITMANVPDSFNPKDRPFTVGAYCQPAAADGVLVAMGDKSNGFSLYLKGGVPHFAIRSNGELMHVVADDPVVMHQWVHLAGAIDTQGRLRLIVNAWPVSDVSGKFLSQKPDEPFCAGADMGSAVGDYSTPMHWRGLIQDMRLYWGYLARGDNREQWGDWANLPGCCSSK
jgi:hypothetical protein